MRLPGPSKEQEDLLANIVVILVRTEQPRNIGATARAMKSMGLTRLRLVQPKYFPHPQAEALAVSAGDILRQASCHCSLDQALADVDYSYALCASDRTVNRPKQSLSAATPMLLTEASRSTVALVFGQEQSGLSNDELARCQRQLIIPSHPHLSSLNVAAAVQVVAYALYQGVLDIAPEHGLPTGVGAPALDAFWQRAEAILKAKGYFNNKDQARSRAKLQELLQRSRPSQPELNLLLGLLQQLCRE